jgi:hypothetical protein
LAAVATNDEAVVGEADAACEECRTDTTTAAVAADGGTVNTAWTTATASAPVAAREPAVVRADARRREGERESAAATTTATAKNGVSSRATIAALQ